MWRWVTRGLVLSLVALFAPLLFAQTAPFLADIDSPAATNTQSGMIVVKGWVLDPNQLSELHLNDDDQYQHKANIFLPYIDVIDTYTFRRIRRVFIRDQIVGPLVAVPVAAGDPAAGTATLRLFGITQSGVLQVTLTAAELQ